MTDFNAPPKWAKKVVWYQIFPERFHRGHHNNDPVAADQKGAWPHDHLSPLEPHPWTSDWYRLQPYEKENDKDIWLNIQRRRYGGDLQGIIEKLDYLQDLGIGALYLNPVFYSPSHHKYDAVCFHHVDPNFGPDPAGDRKLMEEETFDDPAGWVWTSADKLLLELIRKVHERGMRIILDGVFNHVGLMSPIFREVAEKQQKSRYAGWIAVEQWEDKAAGKPFRIRTWEGYNELPEFRQDRTGLTAGPKQYVFDITRRWMDPQGDGDLSRGIDGWRLDVAYCIKHPFWKAWRKHVRSINPDAYLVAEVIDNVKKQKPYLKGDEFDAVMNYNFAFACTEFFIRDKNRLNVSQFDVRLKELRESYRPEVTYVMQNLLDSHDTDRLASRIVNRNLASIRDWRNYYFKSKGENPEFDTGKPDEEGLRIQKLIALFQMTYPGAPMIYYGDEAGIWGANDPCCRKPMIWPELNYEDETVLPDGTPRKKPSKVFFNKDLHDWYRRLIHIRNSCKALQLGNYKTVLVDDKKEIYVFSRSYKGATMLVIINNSQVSREVKTSVNKWETARDVINKEHFKMEDDHLNIYMEYVSGRILTFNHNL